MTQATAVDPKRQLVSTLFFSVPSKWPMTLQDHIPEQDTAAKKKSFVSAILKTQTPPKNGGLS